MFEDPAVMRIVQGRPSLKVTQVYLTCAILDLTACLRVILVPFFPLLKGLDSAIVDCGNAVYWNSFEDDVSAYFFCSPFLFGQLMSPFILTVHGTLLQKDQEDLRIITSGLYN